MRIMQRIIKNNLYPSKNNEYPLFVISWSLFVIIFSLFSHYFSLFAHYFIIICALDIIIFIILLPKKARTGSHRLDPGPLVQAKYPGRKIGSYSDGLGLEARRIGAWRPLSNFVPAVTICCGPRSESAISCDALEGQGPWCRSECTWILSDSVPRTWTL